MVAPHYTNQKSFKNRVFKIFFRRGAIKLFETLGVLIVFMVLLGFAFIFYSFIQRSTFEQELATIAEEQSRLIAEKALLLPELDCSLTGITDITCMDTLKIRAFSSMTQASPEAEAAYFTVFKNSRITVRHLWPTQTPALTLYERTPDTVSTQLVFTSPILLRDPLTSQQTFGLLEVTTYGLR